MKRGDYIERYQKNLDKRNYSRQEIEGMVEKLQELVGRAKQGHTIMAAEAHIEVLQMRLDVLKTKELIGM